MNNTHKNAILVGVRRGRADALAAEESLDELLELLRGANGREAGRLLCEVRRVSPRYYIGEGHLARLVEMAADPDVDFLVFDEELSPSQQRNLEESLEKMVMDRTGLILDIFAARAQSAEGKLQVELAQLIYNLPRLRGMWAHLSRQGAGIGTRGPGETSLEIDHRRIEERIIQIRKRLDKVSRTRDLHRRRRHRTSLETVSLIGYTNAGKSTLFNLLTGAGVVAEDKLFATLDPTCREIVLPTGYRLLITDTVGFIRKLPHQLIESFKATFEEAADARFLLHIIDASHPKAEDRIDSVMATLRDIKFQEKEIIHVLNKIDLCPNRIVVDRLLQSLNPAVAVSALTGEGVGDLLARLAGDFRRTDERMDFAIPAGRPDLVHQIHREGRVQSVEYGDEVVTVTAWVDARLAHILSEYRK